MDNSFSESALISDRVMIVYATHGIGDQLKQDTRYSLKDQRPKIKLSNDLIWLSELVSRLVVYTPIILSNP